MTLAGIAVVRKAQVLSVVSVLVTACSGGGGSASSPTVTPPLPPASESFSFLAYGDSRAGTTCAGNGIHMRLVQRMAAEPASFTFHLGDMIAGGSPRTNWIENGDCTAANEIGSFKQIIAPLQTKTPPVGLPTTYFPVVGNHDDNWGSNWYPDPFGHGFCDVFDAVALGENHTAQPWYSTVQSSQYSDAEFDRLMCSKNPAERDVYPRFMYYSFNFKNSHFVVLRINSDGYDLEVCNNCAGAKNNYDDYYNIHQLDWLRQDLARASADTAIQNIFVFLHTPLFTSWNHPPNVSRRLLLPEFSKYKVRAVFSGHNHIYERTIPIYATAGANGADPELTQDNVNGTTYIVTGGGGSPLDDNYRGPDPYVTVEQWKFHYVKVEVNGANVVLKTIDADGNEIDTFGN